MMTNIQTLFQEKFPDIQFSTATSLADKSYFKIGGLAELFYEAKDIEECKRVLRFAYQKQVPISIFGGASNVLITDQGIKGLVVKILFSDWQVIKDDSQEYHFQVSAGLKTSLLAAKSARAGATGLEGFIGVPGSVGGAVYNNAHYLDFLIGNYIESVESYNFAEDKTSIFSHEKCQFAYEKSVFQDLKSTVILRVTFRLKKGEPEIIAENLREAQQRRQNSQPLDLPSSGCFFQNPLNTDKLRQQFPQFAEKKFIPAGFLIEQAGLKGLQIGNAQISNKHAAFIVNLGQARENDVKKIVQLVKEKVKANFDLDLKEEVFYLSNK